MNSWRDGSEIFFEIKISGVITLGTRPLAYPPQTYYHGNTRVAIIFNFWRGLLKLIVWQFQARGDSIRCSCTLPRIPCIQRCPLALFGFSQSLRPTSKTQDTSHVRSLAGYAHSVSRSGWVPNSQKLEPRKMRILKFQNQKFRFCSNPQRIYVWYCQSLPWSETMSRDVINFSRMLLLDIEKDAFPPAANFPQHEAMLMIQGGWKNRLVQYFGMWCREQYFWKSHVCKFIVLQYPNSWRMG